MDDLNGRHVTYEFGEALPSEAVLEAGDWAADSGEALLRGEDLGAGLGVGTEVIEAGSAIDAYCMGLLLMCRSSETVVEGAATTVVMIEKRWLE